MLMDYNNQNIEWMKVAFREAEKAFQCEEVPIGAVVVKDGKIVGRGYNQTETLKDGTAHAEMIAITSAASSLGDWRLDDCILYVTKEPCLMCAGAIVNSRIKMVFFGAYDERYGCASSLYQLCNSPKFPHRAAVRGGIMKDECTRIIQEFFHIQRAKKERHN
tara:strand:- start:126 stop:611 length:486 start_codon:yes stop_codon:yes gene_type:complete